MEYLGAEVGEGFAEFFRGNAGRSARVLRAARGCVRRKTVGVFFEQQCDFANEGAQGVLDAEVAVDFLARSVSGPGCGGVGGRSPLGPAAGD